MQNYHEHSDFTYFNITISNQQDKTFTILAETTQYNTQSIVRDTTDRVLSIERLNIPTSSVPLFVARPIVGYNPLDPRLIQSISLSYNGEISTFNLKYIPIGTINTLGYWHVFSYDNFARMVNETLKECLVDLATKTTLPINIEAPYIIFNKESQLFSLIVQKVNYNTDLINYVKITCNAYFQQKFDAFPFAQNSSTGGSPNNPELFQYLVFDTYENTFNTDYFKMTQNYNILSEWNSLRAIRIKSNLPIESEFIESRLVSTGQTNSENILKDFTINYNEFSSTGRTEVVYSTRDREYLSLLPNQSITNIYIKIFWIDELGQSNELKLQSYETAIIKLLVKRKDMMF